MVAEEQPNPALAIVTGIKWITNLHSGLSLLPLVV